MGRTVRRGRGGLGRSTGFLPADLEEAGGWDLHQLDRYHMTLTVKCRIQVPGFLMFESRIARLDHFGSDGSLKVIFVNYKLSKNKNCFRRLKRKTNTAPHLTLG